MAVCTLDNPPAARARLRLKRGLPLYMAACLSLAILLSALIDRSGYGLRLTRTASMESAVYVLKPVKTAPDYGDIVVFEAPERSKVQGGDFIKHVLGRPGDVVSVRERVVYVNEARAGYAKPTSLKGQKLEAARPGVIPDQFYFVYSPHKDGYDSRYFDVGLIHISQMKHTAQALF